MHSAQTAVPRAKKIAVFRRLNVGPGGTVRFGTCIFPKVLYEIEDLTMRSLFAEKWAYLPVPHLVVDSDLL